MTKGIVIYYQEYKEHDAIIHILGEDQVYSCVCKGVLKINSKNKSAIQLFTYSDFEFVDNQRSMKTLKHATMTMPTTASRKAPDRWTLKIKSRHHENRKTKDY